MPTQSPTPIPIQTLINNENPQSTTTTQIAKIQFSSVGILAQGDNIVDNYQNYSPVNNFTKNNNI